MAASSATRSFQDWNASLSSDGRYLLFTSDESGQQREVYVLDLEGGGKWRISTSGGDRAKWGSGDREIFYATTDGYLMSVPVLNMEQFKVGQPERLFIIGPARNYADYGYDVSGDGRRFAYVARLYDEASQKNEFVITLSWPAALKQK
jgi:dipeptidyl aminopeptidase/acylaminoacyl peptidase